jgi:alkylation response protein AidB-like acyl-CoA dehydrogenase
MAFTTTDEQRQLRTAFREFLDEVSPETEVRRVMATVDGFDRQVWHRAAVEIGIQGLLVSERLGGSGAGFVEVATACEEMGRRLLPGPYLSTLLATLALTSSTDIEKQETYLPGIASGTTIGTLAVAGESGGWSTRGLSCTAKPDGTGWTLHGSSELVTDAHVADIIVVAADSGEGVGLFVVERAAAAGLAISLLEGFDRTRRLSRLVFDGVPARAISGADADTLERLLQLGSVALAAEQVGGAQACLDMAVQYAKDRVQFGRAIGSFQAIKHLLADTLLEVESARSAAYYAAWSIVDETPDSATVIPLAKAYCSDAFLQSATTNMQVHGGISFTWEHPAHLYYRRAKASAQLLGSPREHRELLAVELGL